MKRFTFFMVLIFALSACKSVDKLYQDGDYKQLISKLESKAKKGKLDRNEKNMLIKSINKYADEVNSEVLASLGSVNPSEWLKGRKKLIKLDEKINEIKSYSQIGAGAVDGSRFDELYPKLNQKLYDHTLDKYDVAIVNYDQSENRSYAKTAYQHAAKLLDYGGDYETVEGLKEQAIELGHRVIYVDMDGPIGHNFEFRTEFERNLDLDNDLFNTFVDFGQSSQADYRFEIDVDIVREDSNKETREDRYTDRVVDYYENVVDTSSNSTNQVPVYKDIEAIVETTRIFRYVEGEYEYEIWDLRKNRRFDSGRDRRRVEEQEEVYTLVSGDKDAVPSGINLTDNRSIFREDYDDLREELFRLLSREFNNDVDIKDRLY